MAQFSGKNNTEAQFVSRENGVQLLGILVI